MVQCRSIVLFRVLIWLGLGCALPSSACNYDPVDLRAPAADADVSPGGDRDRVYACSGFVGGTFAGTAPGLDRLLLAAPRIWPLSETWLDLTELRGHWSLDESPAVNRATLADATGGHAATFVTNDGAIDKAVAGKLDGGLQLDGVDDRVEIPRSTDLEWGSRDFTAHLWVNPSACAENGAKLIESYGGGSPAHWVLACWDPGGLTLSAQDRAGVRLSPELYSFPSRMSVGAWNQVAVRRRGSEFSLYLNGRLVDRLSASLGSLSTGQPISVGGRPSSDSTRYLRGHIDEVALWGRALSDAEIALVYAMQAPPRAGMFESAVCDAGAVEAWTALSVTPQAPYGKPVPPSSEAGYPQGNADTTGLAALWSFDGDPGPVVTTDIIADGSSGGNDGVVTGSDLMRGAGRMGEGLVFAGGPGRLEASSALNPGDSPFTVALWTRVVPVDQIGELISKTDGSSAWALSIADNDDRSTPGRRLVTTFEDSITSWRVSSSVAIADGAWHHVALVATPTPAASLTVYIDGAAAAPTPLTASVFPVIANVAPVVMGENLIGTIDDASIWRRALSADDVAAWYQRGISRLRFQVRACTEPSCTGVHFSGDANDAGSFFSEARRTDAMPPAFDLAGLPATRYLQWRVFMDSNDPDVTPELIDVAVRWGQ